MVYYQKESKTDDKIYSIEVNSILPNPNQPRKIFTEESILKLADSINQFGIIQPLTVRKTGDTYELIAGERRLRASKELGLTHVPCIIADVTQEKSAEISIIENLIRENLNIFEQAEAIEALIDTYGLTQEQIAKRLSNSQSFVANKLRLLRLSASEREQIIKNSLTERHARALLRVLDSDLRAKLLNQIIEQSLNVAEAEALIESSIGNSRDKEQKAKIGYKDISSFYTAINRAIELVKDSGFAIKSRKIEGDKYTELTILIPKDIQTAQETPTDEHIEACV